MGQKNVELRRLQYRTCGDPLCSVTLAARFVEAKIKNCRTLLRRNALEMPDDSLQTLATSSVTYGESLHRKRSWASKDSPPESTLATLEVYFGPRGKRGDRVRLSGPESASTA
jgi:hypothetical protein